MPVNNIGRPFKFNNLDQVNKDIDAYFAYCDSKLKPYTITGLALWLDCDIDTIKDYRDRVYKDEETDLSRPFKKAWLRCFNFAYEQILTAKNPAGSIFVGKNYGMVDKQELTLDANITQTIKPILDD